MESTVRSLLINPEQIKGNILTDSEGIDHRVLAYRIPHQCTTPIAAPVKPGCFGGVWEDPEIAAQLVLASFLQGQVHG